VPPERSLRSGRCAKFGTFTAGSVDQPTAYWFTGTSTWNKFLYPYSLGGPALEPVQFSDMFVSSILTAPEAPDPVVRC
jgi:hypothetical protein